jgi:ABC-type Fe3+-hydroxamate transport system substrate-binding protein
MAPERIVSLVPSLTEALFVFGVGRRVVGRTRYCQWPPREVGRVPTVGGTKKVDVARLLELEPDLVVAVKEENSRENVEKIQAAGVPVFVGAPESVEGAIWLLRELARVVDAPRVGPVLDPIERVYDRLLDGTVRAAGRRVFVPIWKNPYMSVGSDTYAHDVLETCGAENVCAGSTRYPVLTLEEVEAAQPDIILLPDEPYPFCADDLEAFYDLEVPAAREDRVFLVDGKLLTWYGPRMASSLTQLAAIVG